MGSFVTDLTTRWRVARAAPGRGARSLVWQPHPRGVGSAHVGRRILGGTWHLTGQVVEGSDPWALKAPSLAFARALHGFGWLDDVMAVGDARARHAAQGWIAGWLRRYGRGRGPGWAPALAGRRLLRWLAHAPALLGDMDDRDQAAWFEAAYRHAGYLRRHARDAPAGLARMEAAVGLLYAGLVLEGMDGLREDATSVLAEGLRLDIAEDGGIASRNPEALLEMMTLLGWAVGALRDGGHEVPRALVWAQARAIPALRSLRHADGRLARFHGGSGGRDGQLDRVLAESGIRDRAEDGMAMGFLSVAHGRTSLIVDAAVPPRGEASASAHASTGAFELSSGAGPVIVSCGPGGAFGPDWHRAGRATAFHSTVEIEGASSSRIGPVEGGPGARYAPLIQGPTGVQVQRASKAGATTVILRHDGYARSHGLHHLRRLVLSTDGRRVQGEDALRAIGAADKDRFARVLDDGKPDGLTFHVRFHFHPDTSVELGMGGTAAAIELPTGETWVLRTGRPVSMRLDSSVHLDPARLSPRPAQQVVFTDRVLSYSATIDWTLTRTQEARDLPPSPAERPGRF
ncbi:heparinase II/III family protein [Jannaschia aquimarina]|uniref:Heparinase II/III-like protein n=1 Tax=Jannaschia aquimarina TaxID=935700 RepID=A0A0D1EI09_9RHOB|nr:heparinase II/III family protein [Jannaschia aquimarina]KIT15480.1 Heparinase II/III-like protein [Jannaschia aquimarina]SNT33950.1 Uncharacterized conserved protein, heparinase superfamily [Jannaschia aquimarina]